MSTHATPTNDADATNDVASANVVVPRSSVDFFANAAPKLHAYVRAVSEESAALRKQNESLRADVEILDGVSDFLRELSKTDLNYREFMALKTAEVEAAKKKQSASSSSSSADQPPVAKKDLPPVVVKPAAAAAPTRATSSSAAAVSAPNAGMFAGMKGGFFGAAQPAKPSRTVTPASTAPSSSHHTAPAPSSSPDLPTVPVPHPAAVAAASRPKKSQKRAPPPPAGAGASYVFTPACSASHNPPLRHVAPYAHEYRVFAKRRWLGRALLDVLISDFKPPDAEPSANEDDEAEETTAAEEEPNSAATAAGARAYAEEYYRSALARGAVRVNDRVVSAEYVLRSGDHLVHATHRHEPPVLDSDPISHSINIVADTPDLLVVNKPCGLPVHESGKSRHNSLLGLLWNQAPHSGQPLYPVHRLDRVTSGIVILAKHTEAASRMATLMKFDEDGGEGAAESPSKSNSPAEKKTKNVEKVYLARVSGEFPIAPPTTGGVRGLTLATDGRLSLDAPILTVSLRRGIHAVEFESTRGAKSARTLFERLSYDPASDTSVVRAQPLTGRTHQIRLHLQYLGHPIINDPVYGPAAWEGNTYASLDAHPHPDVVARRAPAFDDTCAECRAGAYYNPRADAGRRYCTGIFLHAVAYATIGVEPPLRFETPAPEWASDTFDVHTALGQQVRTSARAADLLAAATAKADASATSAPAIASAPTSSATAATAATSKPRMHVRASRDTDVDAIHAIYAYWVEHGTGTFEELPAPSRDEMAQRRAALLSQGLPYLVATVDDGTTERVIGYAYAGPFRARSAYRFTLEDSIYVSPSSRGLGVGRTLLAELVRVSRELGFRELVALIGDRANAASIALHAQAGFEETGEMKRVGLKFGRWLDVVLMRLALHPNEDDTKEVPETRHFNPDQYVYEAHRP